MAASQDGARGMDFWAALGIGKDTPDEKSTETQRGKSKTGEKAASGKRATPAEGKRSGPRKAAFAEQPGSANQGQRGGKKAPAKRAELDLEATLVDEKEEWSSMFSGRNASPPDEAAPPPQAAAAPPAANPPRGSKPAQASATPPAGEISERPDPRAIPITTPRRPEESPTGPERQAARAASKESAPAALRGTTMPDASAREPQATLEPASRVRNQAHDDETPAHVTYEPQTRRRAPQTAWRTDFDGTAPEDWAGPPDLRSGVPQEQTAATLLTGWREFTQLWRDERVNEVHIRGTRVTVSGVLGVYSMPGFSSLGAARQAIEGITATRAEIGADVLRIGDSIVVTRRQLVSPNTAWLVTAGILTEEQLAQVKTALDHTRAVTLTGAAAPVIMRSLAALIPAGSRVFEAPYGVLPAWCVTAASPLDADYVIGVRPGQLAEKMAATSQIGALIANPETQFTAAVHLNVSGRSTAPGKVTTR